MMQTATQSIAITSMYFRTLFPHIGRSSTKEPMAASHGPRLLVLYKLKNIRSTEPHSTVFRADDRVMLIKYMAMGIPITIAAPKRIGWSKVDMIRLPRPPASTRSANLVSMSAGNQFMIRQVEYASNAPKTQAMLIALTKAPTMLRTVRRSEIVRDSM